MDELRSVEDTIEREHWLKRLAEAVDVSVEELRKALKMCRHYSKSLICQYSSSRVEGGITLDEPVHRAYCE